MRIVSLLLCPLFLCAAVSLREDRLADSVGIGDWCQIMNAIGKHDCEHVEDPLGSTFA